MKRKLTVLILLALALSLAACGGTKEEEDSGGYAYMANPWVDCATLEEAADLAGFQMAVPDRIEGYPNTMIQAVKKDTTNAGPMIQVFYFDGSPEDENSTSVLLRKAPGTEDISGDYNEYTEVETVAMHGVDVTLSGEDGLVHNAIWSQDGYSYCIFARNGLDRETVTQLAELMK